MVSKSAMITVWISKITINGKASAANSHNFIDIKAIDKNNDRDMLPIIEISFIGRVFFWASAIFLIIAAITIGPRYPGKTNPSFLLNTGIQAPIPIAKAITTTESKRVPSEIGLSDSNLIVEFPVSSSVVLAFKLYFCRSLLATGPPIKHPATSPNVAEAIATEKHQLLQPLQVQDQKLQKFHVLQSME